MFNSTIFLILQIPHGVMKDDWDILSDKKAAPQKIGESMKNIVLQVVENLVSQGSVHKKSNVCSSPEFTRLKSPKRKRMKVENNHNEEQNLYRNDTLILNQKD